MITRIEIDGFKSFQDFSVDLKPFQVLIGANGVGKSNLFDAIMLLSNLAGNQSVYDAFRQSRGEVSEMFTLRPDGERFREIKFAVELLIDKEITDELGQTEQVSSTRLRYELHIERRIVNSFERLYVNYESLSSITEDDDRWFRANINVPHRKQWIQRARRSPYISTETKPEQNNARESQIFVFKHQEGRQGRKSETPIGNLERTVLSTITSVEYPTAYAARREMLNWQFMQFEPRALRTPSSIYEKSTLKADGSNLAAVLWRMEQQDKQILNDISIDMANIVPGIVAIKVQILKEREEILIEAITEDRARFSSRVLSDGTLRLLALITLRNDDHQKGIVCFEEPENGVNPAFLAKAVHLLQDMATKLNPLPDENRETVYDEVLRQVIINTHSPEVIAIVDDPEAFLFIHMIGDVPRKTIATNLSNKLLPDEAKSIQSFTYQQVRRYLNPKPIERALEQLDSYMPRLTKDPK